MNVFAFSIRTVPDIDSSRRLYDLHGLSDEDVVKAVLHRRRQQADSEALAHHLQRIVSISAVLRHADQFRVWSLGDESSTEAELLQRFFSGIERYTPDLLSWNGSRHDFPVIHYRSLLYGINAGTYWRPGENNVSIRRVDLTQTLGGRSSHEPVPLSEMAGLCGFPRSAGHSAIDACDTFLRGDIVKLRNDGEIDALKTYLIYLRFFCNNGHLDIDSYQRECELVREALQKSAAGHLQTFYNDWIDL